MTFIHHVPQHSVTPLCGFTVFCLIAAVSKHFQFKIIPLTVDRRISSRDEISQTDLSQLKFTVLFRMTNFYFPQMFVNAEWVLDFNTLGH